jgi:sugar O-acyltransferase (sialic acid O-acetyltransferase NeuD family)
MKIIILGHSNSVLAMLLDIIDISANIDIISNILNDDNTPYLIDNMNINEFIHDNYIYNNYNEYILGVNSPHSKNQVFNFFKINYNIKLENYTNIYSQDCYLPKMIKLGKGIVIYNKTTIAPFTQLDNFVTINRNCSIGHHNIIGEFTTIGPGVNIAGHCIIGSNTTIGPGVTIVNKIKIGNNVIIGAGSVVTKDIPDNQIWYGVPAKFIKNII